MEIEPHYKIKPVSPAYKSQNNVPEKYYQPQQLNYQKRNDSTLYRNKINFLA